MKKIAIVGCADSKTEAPYNNSEWAIWGVNNLFLSLPPGLSNIDKWFEIHNIAFDGKDYIRRGSLEFRGQKVNDYMAGLAKLPCPVMMQKKWDSVPNSEEYPINDILKVFGNYFTNSVSYEIALAIDLIDKGLYEKEMGIWGVDMATQSGLQDNSEYAHQRPSVEFFMGLAIGKGIKLYVPDTADLIKTRYLYGFQEKEKSAWQKKLDAMNHTLKQRMKNAEAQRDIAQKQLDQYIGAIEASKEIKRIWD